MESQPNQNDCSELWIFGYGSLIWKVDFKVEFSLKGYIKGFERKFYQNSTDHRGTKDNPGRVVTLIKNPSAETYGISYKIANNDKKEVLNHLDLREINGYERVETFFYPIEHVSEPKKIILYLATETNPSYAGHKSDLNEISQQIFHSNSGVSGKNREYVYNLADSMRILFPEVVDQHLFHLETLLKQMELDAENL